MLPCSASAGTSCAGPRAARPPARRLDAAAGGAPVYLARVDVHSAVVSSALSDAAGLDRLPGWSYDGRVERDAHHAARDAARQVTPERRTALYRRALEHAAARGVVSVHEHSAPSIDTRAGLVELLELTADATAASRTSWRTAASSASRSTTPARSSRRSRA